MRLATRAPSLLPVPLWLVSDPPPPSVLALVNIPLPFFSIILFSLSVGGGLAGDAGAGGEQNWRDRRPGMILRLLLPRFMLGVV